MGAPGGVRDTSSAQKLATLTPRERSIRSISFGVDLRNTNTQKLVPEIELKRHKVTGGSIPHGLSYFLIFIAQSSILQGHKTQETFLSGSSSGSGKLVFSHLSTQHAVSLAYPPVPKEAASKINIAATGPRKLSKNYQLPTARRRFLDRNAPPCLLKPRRGRRNRRRELKTNPVWSTTANYGVAAREPSGRTRRAKTIRLGVRSPPSSSSPLSPPRGPSARYA